MYASPPELHRRLKVMVWYPADPVGECHRGLYLDLPEQSELPSIFTIMGVAAEAGEFGSRPTASNAGAAVLEGRYPTLVFCHGGMCFPQQNTLLFEDLASHGYVVLSVGHPYESGTHALADGTVLEQSPRILEESNALEVTPDYLAIYFGTRPLKARVDAAAEQLVALRRGWFGRLANDWVRDNVFVVDHIARGDVPPDARMVAKCCDLHRLAYFGMSYGGHVAALACMVDPRAKAGVNMDGGLFTGEVLGREIGVPFLALTSDAALQAKDFGLAGIVQATASSPSSADVMYERPETGEPAADVHRISVLGAKHQDFTDFCWLLADSEAAAHSLGPIGPNMIGVQRRVVRAFFDAHFNEPLQAFPANLDSDLADVLVVQDREQFLRAEGLR